MHATYPKGKMNQIRGYKHITGGGSTAHETDFYGSQGQFALRPEHERMDLYAKPGTSAAKREGEPYSVSLPRSRFRSQFP